MLDIIRFHRAIGVGLFSLILILTACEKRDSGTTAAETQSERDVVDAMSLEHANDSTEPSAAAMVESTRAVDSETLPYADVDNELAYGYLAYPSGVTEPLPAVIMIHEWWGLNDNIRAMANRLAAHGYMVLAVDFYGGEIAANPDEARMRMLNVVENPARARENLRQALDFLTIAGAPRIASLGWCFGGGWSLNAAMLFPKKIDASVIYYGQLTADAERLQLIDAPLIGFFGSEDRGISVDSVKAFERTLQRLRKDHEIRIYPGVRHAFANPTGNNYNAEAAEDAWRRTLDFLDANLKASDSS